MQARIRVYIPVAPALRRVSTARRRVAAVALVCALALVCPASVSAASADAASPPGGLDLSFDGDGKAITQIGSFTDQAHEVALQPDGRIVVAGFSESGTGRRFAVVRHNADGSLDASFDGDGKVTTAIGTGSRDEAYAVALQPDRKIVVAGDSYDASNNSHLAVVRYNADGSLDTGFDGDGKVTTVVGGKSHATAVAVQGDGRIMVAGAGTPCVGCGLFPALARYNPDGSLDTSFNDDKASTPSGTRVMTDDFGNGGVARALAIQGDGKIVVAGDVFHFNNRVMFVFRLEAGGGSDPTFGLAITDIAWEPNRATDLATAVDTLADGRIVVAGFTQVGSSFQIAALRYRDNGSLDPTFDGDGIVTTAVGTFSQGFGVAVDVDGRTVVAGDSFNGANKDLALVRYGADGSLDPAFGSGGIVTTPVGTAADQARGVALQPDGRIVVAGFSDNGINQDDFVVARYHGDPPPDIAPPTVQCSLADGAWHPADVSIACTASDAESGLADPSDASFSLSTNVAVGTEDANASTNSREVCDQTGSCATAGPITGNMIDKKDPVVSIARPGEETYLLNQAVSASHSCADGGSGIASCSGPVADGASLDTASVGTKSVTVSATDGVGNAASETVTYVVAYDVSLLYDPAKPTRRIKLRLHDANGANVSSPTTVLTVQSIDGSTGAGGTFTYSKGADGYVYAVDTRGLSSGSHSLEFTAGADPTVHSVPFMVR
jgi:uncharacterized delta-60 repeat protein